MLLQTAPESAILIAGITWQRKIYMTIHFDMEHAIDNHERWWRGELGRTLALVIIPDAHPVQRRC